MPPVTYMHVRRVCARQEVRDPKVDKRGGGYSLTTTVSHLCTLRAGCTLAGSTVCKSESARVRALRTAYFYI
jgi:hypothetical protein